MVAALIVFAATWSSGLDLLASTCGKAYVPDAEELPSVDRPWADEVVGVSVRLTDTEVRLEGRPMTSVPALGEALGDVLGQVRQYQRGEDPVLLLAVEADVSPARVLQVLRVAHDAGVDEVRFLARGASKVSWTYPDPRFADELDHAIHEIGRGRAQAVLARSVPPLAEQCPDVIPTLEHVADAAPRDKCERLVTGLRSTLASCPAESADQLVTVFMVPAAVPYEVAAWSVELDPETKASPKGRNWKKWSRKLLKAEATTVAIGE